MNEVTKTVEYYLDLYGIKDNFTVENALDAMLSHYQEVKMPELYLDINPNEDYILLYDRLSISIYSKSQNYIELSFSRNFMFEHDYPEETQIRLQLHFENEKDNSRNENYVEIDNRDGNEINEEKINSIKEDKFYQQIKNLTPTKYELYVHYDI